MLDLSLCLCLIKRKEGLFILDDNKRLDIKKLIEQIDEKGLRLGSEENLFEKMNLKFGVVSLFGLLKNKDKDIKVYIDKELLNEDIITFIIMIILLLYLLK